jgi:hypothetical protein
VGKKALWQKMGKALSFLLCHLHRHPLLANVFAALLLILSFCRPPKPKKHKKHNKKRSFYLICIFKKCHAVCQEKKIHST